MPQVLRQPRQRPQRRNLPRLPPPKAPVAGAPAPVAPRPAASRPRPQLRLAPAASGSGGERIHSSPLVRRMAFRACNRSFDAGRHRAGGRIASRTSEAVIAAAGAPNCSCASALLLPVPAAASRPNTSTSSCAGSRAGSLRRQAHVALETAVLREKCISAITKWQPMSTMRQRIAETTWWLRSASSAHVYSVDEIDMTKVAALRAKSKDEFEKRYETKLTFHAFFVKAAVAGLRAYPTLNASLDGTNVVLHKEIQRRYRRGGSIGACSCRW